jgi:hypothetical protein
VDHKIEVVGYIPCGTHVLQGLNIACFGAFKTYYSQAQETFECDTGQAVSKDTLEVLPSPYKQAFTHLPILAGFWKTGFYSVDRTAVKIAEVIAPSEDTSESCSCDCHQLGTG